MIRHYLIHYDDCHQGRWEMKLVDRTQRLLFILGSLMIAIYVAAFVHKQVVSRAQMKRFDALRTEAPIQRAEIPVSGSEFAADFNLWSKKRISEYEESLAAHFDPPLAVLHISKFQLHVPVLEGTDELTLNRGTGHIAGTARPGEEGNIGIAGHRDGFFRVLKDISPGDTIELQTARVTDRYIVDQIVLVRPNDVSVLQRRPVRSLTLVTCYPFYFIGSAPQRYIVQASIVGSDGTDVGRMGETSVRASQR